MGKHNLNYLRLIKYHFSKRFPIPNTSVNMFFIRLLSQHRFETNELLLELKTRQQCSIHCRSITLVARPLSIQSQPKKVMNDIVRVEW